MFRFCILLLCFLLSSRQPGDVVVTVAGPVAPETLGATLPHEHVMVDFIGADSIVSGRYNADSVFNKVLPQLQELKRVGGNTLFECTPNYLGRDAKLLFRLSKASGINIVTNTGYYGAVNHKYLPRHAYSESAQQIADRWIAEFNNGIDGTGIKPGFIKLSADKGPLTELQRKVVTAGAIAHRATQLTIAIHSGDGNAAREELKILMDNGVAADNFIWVHAQNEKDFNVFKEIAGKGAWVEFDGLNEDNVGEYVAFLKYMKEKKLLHRTLVSHDAGWYNVGDANGGNFRGYTTLFVQLVPALRKAGFTDDDLDLVINKNPSLSLALQP